MLHTKVKQLLCPAVPVVIMNWHVCGRTFRGQNSSLVVCWAHCPA